MYASVQKHDLSAAEFFRFCGRACGVVVIALWLMMVIADIFRSGAPTVDGWYQAGFLAVVFVGYVVGWRHEMLGGALALAGTVGFIVLNLAQFGMYLSAGAQWFAVPGICYLVAHFLDKPRKQYGPSQS